MKVDFSSEVTPKQIASVERMVADEFDDDGWETIEDEDGCCHEDHDLDILTGRCHCYRCGERWYASDAEILHAVDCEAAYARWEDEEHRRQWWRDLYYRLTAPLRPLRRWWARRKPDADDEIPF